MFVLCSNVSKPLRLRNFVGNMPQSAIYSKGNIRLLRTDETYVVFRNIASPGKREDAHYLAWLLYTEKNDKHTRHLPRNVRQCP